MTQAWLDASFLSMGQLPELLTVAEVAKALRLTDETIHRWCREGKLDYVDVRGVKRFHRDYIADLVRSNEQSPAGAA